MLTFTHTYLINLSYKKVNNINIPLSKGEIILGNVIPDFVTHLGRAQYQATAHNLNLYSSLTQHGLFEWGAMFHILCDNFSTLGRLMFEGNYQNLPKNGFIERLSRKVVININLKIPRRRILQCAFDMLVIREEKQLLINMLEEAESFLKNNITEILHRIATIYNIDQRQLKIGLARFSQIYCSDFIEYASLEKYRLFPLIRSLLNLGSLTDPRLILKEIESHPELMEVVESNMHIIIHSWQDLLNETVQQVLKFPGMEQALKTE